MHLFFTISVILYVQQVYIFNSGGESNNMWTIVLGCGIIYPATYDTIQMFRDGREYWQDPWNVTDFGLIWFSIFNIAIQNLLEPFDVICRANMIVVVVMILFKTFFFLRVFVQISYIVTMIRNVVIDLLPFLTFFSILTILLSLMIGILGIGNFVVPGKFAQENSIDDDGYFG